ncbi:hypothetical protein [Methanoregula sp.]|uniref:hypothetical protein n=1 Tax=Methanoregula sp. TaxID=2052170 RepID=UPI002CC0D496|nr:hypothetical protein [Methanoregula sp.]HVP96963.1 hypothetical protein [Methanoregula sp.]
MDLFELITVLSILIECTILVLAILLATCRGKAYGWLIAITFALFALFDSLRVFYPSGLPRLNAVILLAGCASMLYALWLLYEETGKNNR